MKQSLIKKLSLLLILNLLVALAAISQDAAPPVDNTNLTRSEPLFVIENVSGSQLLAEISDTLKSFGFEVVKLDNRDMQIESTRKIRQNKNDYDKVIVWLERDFLLPQQFIKVYFLFGRFLDIVSSETRVRRIEVSEIEEENIIGDLKKSLISISNKN